jgi:hypothetical protein
MAKVPLAPDAMLRYERQMQQSNKPEQPPGNQQDSEIRGSTAAGVVFGTLMALGVLFTLHAVWAVYDAQSRRAEVRMLVKTLGLTDIALLTEARYTRHLSLADLHSPFQDAPMVIEHFPAGSLVAPTRRFPASHLTTRAPRKEAE